MMTELETRAQAAGREAGEVHANFTVTYGGEVVPEDITVPDRFASVETFYIAGFEEGVSEFFDGGDALAW